MNDEAIVQHMFILIGRLAIDPLIRPNVSRMTDNLSHTAPYKLQNCGHNGDVGDDGQSHTDSATGDVRSLSACVNARVTSTLRLLMNQNFGQRHWAHLMLTKRCKRVKDQRREW